MGPAVPPKNVRRTNTAAMSLLEQRRAAPACLQRTAGSCACQLPPCTAQSSSSVSMLWPLLGCAGLWPPDSLLAMPQSFVAALATLHRLVDTDGGLESGRYRPACVSAQKNSRAPSMHWRRGLPHRCAAACTAVLVVLRMLAFLDPYFLLGKKGQ